LDKSIGHGWQLHLKNTDLPKYKDLEAFLASRCVALENSEAVMSNESANKIDTHSNSTGKTSKPTHQKRRSQKNQKLLASVVISLIESISVRISKR